jgi:hypothetical protein
VSASWFSRFLAGKRRALPGRGRALRLSEVVFLTVSLLLLSGFFVGGAINDYVQMRQFDDWWSRGARANNLFIRRVQLALNGPRAALAEQRLDAEARDAAIVRLDVPKDQWSALQRDKQTTWGVWYDVGLMRGDVPSPVRIRRRGDTSQHWTTEKMSFTLRTPGSDRFHGFRTLAFSGADVLPQFVALALATDFGLLAPFTTVSPVFVNGQYYGLYQVTETIDDDFLTRHGRLPGVIYQGDAAERGDMYPGVPRGLFMNPYIWEFAAGEIDGVVTDRGPLRSFIDDLNGDTFESHARFMGRLDRSEMARLVSLLLITGDPYHMDNLHNQFWYADPASGTLHPIPWDVRLLDLAKPPTWVNELLRAALRDPFLVDEVLRETDVRLQKGVVARAEKLARETYERFQPHFEYDHLRAGVISDVGKPADVATPLRRNAQLLRKWIQDARIAFYAGAVDNTVVLDLESRGYTGTDLLALEVSLAPSAASGLRMFADRNRNGELDAGDPVIPGRWQAGRDGARFVLNNPEALLPGWDTRGKGIAAGAVHYRFFLDGASATRAPGVRPVVRNRITNEPAGLVPWARGAARTPTLSWSPWQFDAKRGSVVRWSGSVELRETLRLAPSDTLLIAAGTTVRLHPDVSVITRGVIQAHGRPDAPISIVPTVAQRPWGALALQGDATRGSTLRHVRFIGGGGGVVDGVRYSAMLNVHHAPGVLLDGVAFQGDIRTDYALRAVNSSVELRNCSMTSTNARGIGFEFSGGEIRDCRFEQIGDDAIVLTGSSPRILGNHILSAGGSGVAINHDSDPVVFSNEITGTAVGVDVRGGSEPLLVNNSITKNAIGLQQDQARGRGGWAKVIHNGIADNTSDTEIDGSSLLSELQVTGASSVAAREAILMNAGIATVRGRGPQIASWADAARRAPLDAQDFEENFASVSDGWFGQGGVLRLEKRAGVLSATLEKRRGGMYRPVTWTVGSDSALLVLELSGRDVSNVTVTVTGAANPVTRQVQLGAAPGTYSYVVLSLPPGTYNQLLLEATPQRTGWEIDPVTGFQELRRSRLELAGFQLLSKTHAIARR